MAEAAQGAAVGCSAQYDANWIGAAMRLLRALFSLPFVVLSWFLESVVAFPLRVLLSEVYNLSLAVMQLGVLVALGREALERMDAKVRGE